MPDDLHPAPEIGSALRWLRSGRNLQQRQVIEAMKAEGRGVSAVWLSQVERGHRRPSRQLVQRLLRAMAVDPAELEQALGERPWLHPEPRIGEIRSGAPTPDVSNLGRELGELNAAYIWLDAAGRQALLVLAQQLVGQSTGGK